VNWHGHKDRETPNILKTTQANNFRGIFLKAITLEHSKVFNFQVVSFSIFDLYRISKEGYLNITNIKFY
jgi:hypothetical protein